MVGQCVECSGCVVMFGYVQCLEVGVGEIVLGVVVVLQCFGIVVQFDGYLYVCGDQLYEGVEL